MRQAPSRARTQAVLTNRVLAASLPPLRTEEPTAQQPPKGQAQVSNGAGRPPWAAGPGGGGRAGPEPVVLEQVSPCESASCHSKQIIRRDTILFSRKKTMWPISAHPDGEVVSLSHRLLGH